MFVERGAEATIRVRRLNIAERLYRVTGAGIYRDSVLVGADIDVVRLAFPGGAMDMIEAWITSIDVAMRKDLTPEKLGEMKIRERIRTLVQFRLDAVEGQEEAVRRVTCEAPHDIRASPPKLKRCRRVLLLRHSSHRTAHGLHHRHRQLRPA